MAGVDAIVHTATLHKPHVKSHGRVDFVETNVAGTLNLLEEAVAADVDRFVFTSTTSTFGRALTPDGRSRRRGLPRTSFRFRGTSTASPRGPRRISASWSGATTACRA